MKQNSNYILKKLSGIPYLLPAGQMIGDLKPGIQLNETGVYLWKLLRKERSLQDLIRLCAEHYGISTETLPQLEEDILQFTDSLTACGILYTPETSFQVKSPLYKCLKIAGLSCRLFGPREAFSRQFDAFEGTVSQIDSHCDQSIEVLMSFPQTSENGKMLLRNHQLSIMESTDKYILLFPASPQILEAHLAKDAGLVRFYCLPPFTDSLREDLFHAIRLAYLYLAQKHGMAALHSASILYRGKAWLFSACSGTGKSTHTNLWNTLLGTPVLNGDLNLLGIKNDTPVIHGIPWCGTSEIYDTHTYPLGGILLLKQAPEDFVEALSEDKKRLFVLQRLISPAWTGTLLEHNLKLTDALAQKILICRLHCTPHASAVDTIRQEIDAYLGF